MSESSPVQPAVGGPVLFSERLRLRPVTLDDTAAVQSYRGRDDVVRYLTHDPLSLDATRARMRVSVEHWRRYPADWFNANFAAELPAGGAESDGKRVPGAGRVIGDLRAWNLELDASGPATESADVFWIGYAFHPDMQGKGYAREAAARMVRWLFDERSARELRAIAWTPNTASIMLLEKLGFRIFRELPAELEEHPKKLPAVHLRLMRSDWAAAQHKHATRQSTSRTQTEES
ncbi:RimJ/RimL family protein N-acetyltransferase [Microterricola gilva]|uniref:RimJ/RimL family protein N-acetyltransferase n=2 Tax=Microterricola gilva TaxID=393267 RepID=A0A4Q8AI13_9MICO|nr:RimJ/RimL family protein N-acetyltransferase [Microterricola gilva]